MTGTVVTQYQAEYGAANVATTLMFFVGIYQVSGPRSAANGDSLPKPTGLTQPEVAPEVPLN